MWLWSEYFISYKSSYDNRCISDHSLIEFSIDLENKDKHIPIKNPYQYKICEYDVSIENEGWSEFYEAMCAIDISIIENFSPEEQVEFFYNQLELNAEAFLPKKYGFERKGDKKRKFIPDRIRKLLRKKLKLSKRNMNSLSWVKNHKNVEELEKVEYELSIEY